MLWPIALLHVYHHPLFKSIKRVDKLVHMCANTSIYTHTNTLALFTILITVLTEIN